MTDLCSDLYVAHKTVPRCSGSRYFYFAQSYVQVWFIGHIYSPSQTKLDFAASTYNQTDGRKERLHYPYLDLEESKLLEIQQK